MKDKVQNSGFLVHIGNNRVEVSSDLPENKVSLGYFEEKVDKEGNKVKNGGTATTSRNTIANQIPESPQKTQIMSILSNPLLDIKNIPQVVISKIKDMNK